MTPAAARESAGARPGRVSVSGDDFAGAAATVLARRLREAVRDGGGPVSVALAGGSTPREVYARLATEPELPWGRVRILFGDERRVPPDHVHSNYRMARETLLARLPSPPAEVHRMEGEAPDPEAAADRYAALLPAAIDLLILGIGADGHTASLFPGSAAAREASRAVVPSVAPVEPRGRLTITAPVIRAARRIVVLAAGASKAEAVRRALAQHGDPADCPARLARQGTWLLDRAAAARLAAPQRPA